MSYVTKFHISPSGNVGINNDSPTATLDVTGTLEADAWKSASMSANGFAVMGGLKVQWGTVTYTNNNAQTITYPQAFTTVYSVTATVDAGNNSGAGANVPVKTLNIANNNFQVAGVSAFAGDAVSKVRWMAVGI